MREIGSGEEGGGISGGFGLLLVLGNVAISAAVCLPSLTIHSSINRAV